MELMNISEELCKSCKYSWAYSGTIACDYVEKTKHCRLDPKGKCSHYEAVEGARRRRITFGKMKRG